MSQRKTITEFIEQVQSFTPAPEAGGFLIPKEMVPAARHMAGLCAKCGHALDFGEHADTRDSDGVNIIPIEFYNSLKCQICGHATTDEIAPEDVEDYDSERDAN